MSEAFLDLMFWIVALAVIFFVIRWLQRRRSGEGDHENPSSDE
ncbi:MAG: hypothetical protein AAFN09_06050 [Pseudomonadota bacterium]